MNQFLVRAEFVLLYLVITICSPEVHQFAVDLAIDSGISRVGNHKYRLSGRFLLFRGFQNRFPKAHHYSKASR